MNISEILSKIRFKYSCQNDKTLADVILKRNVYFRVSLCGFCNNNCLFCHNEGAPKSGILDLQTAYNVFHEASNIGYNKIQFTGGEPLLHPQVEKFIDIATVYFQQVGLTSNGLLLHQQYMKLLSTRIDQFHISLTDSNTVYDILFRIKSIVKYLKIIQEHEINIQINLPLFGIDMIKLKKIIRQIEHINGTLVVFETFGHTNLYNANSVELMVNFLKEYLCDKRLFLIHRKGIVPTGIKCTICKNLKCCKESSRSLRFGADKIFRPCLATRIFDEPLDEFNIHKQLARMTLLAIDY
ncbi:MAG: radical SAM protein [Thermodesulfobacteriota bacterium]